MTAAAAPTAPDGVLDGPRASAASSGQPGGGRLGRLAARYREALERALPPGGAADREARTRALMFLVSHTAGPLIGITVPVALWALDPTAGPEVAVLAAGVSLFWAFPALLRWGVPYGRLVLLSVANLNFCILWGCYHLGGVGAPTLPWVLVIPIQALFYVGAERRLQLRLLLVTLAAFAGFAAVSVLAPADHDVPRAALLGLGAVSTAAALAYVATMAVHYARLFDAGRDLEAEIGRRQALAEELRQAVVAADRSAAAKAEVLARVSHEVRTPLNAVIGYGEILEEQAEEEGDAAGAADAGRILDAGRYLLRLVDAVLDLSKLEAGRMTFDPRPHSLGALLARAVAARAADLEGAGVRVAVDVPPDLDAVTVDAARVGQVLDALLHNAARHGAGGPVRLWVTGDGDAVAVAVGDAGPGIAPEAMAALFTSFSAAREAADGRYGGTGLSLALCARLADAMGGGLAAASGPGRGSTFTLTLPRAPPPKGTAGAAGLPDVRT